MTATATRNGRGTDEATFPVDSFREAATHLRRPFTPAAVKFKVQATWDGGGLIVAYIDARLAVERLNLIVPHLWHDEYEPLGGKHLVCRLTVDGITRQDIGEGQGKGLYSDALKRAAVKFGVGVSLYATPSLVLKVATGDLKEAKQDKLALTDKGDATCRSRYRVWLEQHGAAAFGEPLDHGDVEGAQGDTEVDQAPASTETVPRLSAPLPDELVEELFGISEKALALDGWDTRKLSQFLIAAGAKDTSSVHAALSSLTEKGAEELKGELVAALADGVAA
jgi:hypothetical protein